MNLAAIAARILIVTLLGLGCAGCWNNSPSVLDEQKDPNLLKGRSLFAINDYEGAAEAWEKTLQANPRNAEAHFELLVVNGQKLNDYATAIYYGNRFIKLKPADYRMQTVTTIVETCKQRLAKDCFTAPVPSDLVLKFDKLDKENKSLKAIVEDLEKKLYIARLAAASATNIVSNAAPGLPIRMGSPPSNPPPSMLLGLASQGTPLKSKSYKTYIVKARDTVGRIARENNTSVSALTEANPGLNPKKIRPGQTLNIPVR
jgi:tetratricopeptide (TPR) repeat protein